MGMESDLHIPPAPSAPQADKLLHGLNPQQREAVCLPDTHALILAGAGSGKTRVLTTRIAWLLAQQRVSPAGILAVTFTNKAAKEMLARLSGMLPLNVRGMWIGTFHGLCNRFLRAHHQAAQLPQAFQILDIQDQLSAIKRLYKQFDIDATRYPPKQTQWFINGCKEEGMRAKDVPMRDANSRKNAEIYQLYEAQCQREGVVDFGELMLRSYEVLCEHEAIRAHYQRRFRHILVDEFQDTNRMQYLWLKLFVGSDDTQKNAVFAVGDDDQSIYAFRGARVGNMNDFVRELDVQHQIKLEENYRSYSNILDSANALISHNQNRLGKNLRTQAGSGEPVRVLEHNSDLEEARWLVDEVQQLLHSGDMARKDIAVLYRSNAQSRIIETSLFNAGVPYKVYGGLRFFERAEIKHALAYLRLLDNPRDDTSFARVVNFPTRGIGARAMEGLQDLATAENCALYDAIDKIDTRAKANLLSFADIIQTMRTQAQTLSLPDLVRHMLDTSGLLAHYQQERDGSDRVENLEELINAADSFCTQEGLTPETAALDQVSWGADALDEMAKNSLASESLETLSPLSLFLSHASLEAGDNQATAGQDAVQLMTVHASKGLEFKAVFITGLEESLFPHENAMSAQDGLEEERRLLYVAITRARERLYLSYAQSRMLHGQRYYHIRSRFFDELPEDCLKWIAPKNNVFGTSVSSAPEHISRYEADIATPSNSSNNLCTGMQVFHAKFGEGTVLATEGSDLDAKVQVRFKRHGTKWLIAHIAKLTAIE